jgi:hypothetical protein
MKRSTLSVLAIAAFSFAMQTGGASKDRKIAGTYELIICKGACSFANRANAFATAVVVLFDDVMARADRERIAPFYNYDASDVRACYAVDRKVQAPSYVGINNKIGVSPWKLDGNTIQFELFHSPDAGYAVVVNRTGHLLTGTGRSWGAGMGAPPHDYGPDTIVGRRLGPPDMAACASAPTS